MEENFLFLFSENSFKNERASGIISFFLSRNGGITM
jgi:hypothetical protein